LGESAGPLYRFFRLVVAARFWIVALFAILLVPSVYFALKVKQDNALDRLIVKSDPDFVRNRQFEAVFGRGEYVILMAEADDPFAAPVLERIDKLERALAAVPKVDVNSALSIYRRAHPNLSFDPIEASRFRSFVAGTDLFRKQGLYGPGFLAIPVILSVQNSDERAQVVAEMDRALAEFEQHPAPLSALRKLGEPYVNAYLDRDSRTTSVRYFPLFALFVVVLTIVLYRSVRTLIAFLLTLGVSAAMTVGFIGILGGNFSIVSALVPMTVLITCTATLVYLHSRFVERPAHVSVDDHQIFALVNKFPACSASIFSTAVGFGALGVSKIRPIREMGLWVAMGLVFTWIAVFTLFPALQKILRTPTRTERQKANSSFGRFTTWLPGWSYRYRLILVPAALLLCLVGTVAVTGIPRVIGPMQLQTNAIEYINHGSSLYKDTKNLEKKISGLAVSEIWLKGRFGAVTDAEVLKGLEKFSQLLEKQPGVGTVVGPTTILRMMRYVGGQGDGLPSDEAGLEQVAATLETLVPSQPMLQRFVEKTKFDQTHITIISKTVDYKGFAELEKSIRRAWQTATMEAPALKGLELQIVGRGLMQSKISYHLVPTLTESFGLTIVIIFGTFLLVFRSGAARVMAMIPSLFAILVMFLVMRISSLSLSVTTILIASTVLGTSENDQIHFFYHFIERRKQGGTTEECLAYSLSVAGRAIFIATLINAGGFLAFALAELPPVRQFGMLSALAFMLSMIADFTALPAALWMVFRERPDKLETRQEKTAQMRPTLDSSN
jgi:predicted RND superfamily exporter protein